MAPFSPGVVTVREKERALNSSFCLLRFTYVARRKDHFVRWKTGVPVPAPPPHPLPLPGSVRTWRGPEGARLARGWPGARVSCAFTAPLPGFLGGTRAGLQGLDRKRDPCALPTGVPRGYRGSQASAPPDGAGLASSTGPPPRGWGSATIQEGPMLCEWTPILGAACWERGALSLGGRGSPGATLARVSLFSRQEGRLVRAGQHAADLGHEAPRCLQDAGSCR